MTIPPSPTNYVPNQFINRNQEITLVLERVDAIISGMTVNERTVVFIGAYGVGKTWLLAHLFDKLKEDEKVNCLHLVQTDYSIQGKSAEAFRRICERLGKVLYIESTFDGLPFDAISRILIHRIKQEALPQKPLVLFLDGIYEAPKPFLDLLEFYLLAPLAVEPRVLSIMSGRSRTHAWTSPELRLRVVAKILQPFEPIMMREMLAQQGAVTDQQADAIYKLSHGNARASVLLAQAPDQQTAFMQIFQELLEPVAQNTGHRHETRKALEYLSVPRKFEYDYVAPLLAAYENWPYLRPLKRPEERRIVDLLIKAGLAFWDEDESTFKVYEWVRELVLNYLQMDDFPRWQRLQQAMVDKLQALIQRHSAYSYLWQSELTYHQTQLLPKLSD